MTYKTKLLIATTVLVNAGVVMAQPEETAASAFKRGKAALKAGNVHEACEAFAASDNLAATVDTELALADCYVQDGKTATAAKLYRSLADKDQNAARKKTSIAKATKLEAKAPKLRFAINPNPPGLVVKVDGVEVVATSDVLVDAGPHEVTGTAPGYAGHASAPVDKDGQIVDVILRMESTTPEPAPKPEPTPEPKPEPAPAPPPPVMTPPPPEPAMAPDHRKRNGEILTGVGAGLLVGSGVMLAISFSKFSDEHSLCPNQLCSKATDVPTANSLRTDARTLRGLSIGVGIGGAVFAIAGVYLLATPHKAESHVSLSVDHGGGGLAWTGRF